MAGPSRYRAEKVPHAEQLEPLQDKKLLDEGSKGTLGEMSNLWSYPLFEEYMLRLDFTSQLMCRVEFDIQVKALVHMD